MKKIEAIISYFLFALIIWINIEIIYSVINYIENSPTFIFPWRVNHNWILLGIFISGLSGALFPVWDVGKYFKINNLKIISDYKANYKINYFLLMLGFIGLLLTSLSNPILLILGIICLFICYSTLFVLAIKKRF